MPAFDLSQLLLLLPTRHAGRLIERALLHQHRQLLPPRTESPRSLVDLLLNLEPCLEPIQSRLLWQEVLNDGKLSDWKDLFPLQKTSDPAWSWEVAGQLSELCSQAGEARLSLAALENRYESLCNKKKLLCRNLHRRERLKENKPLQLPEGIKALVLAATPDPLPLLLPLLDQLSKEQPELPIHILLHTNPDEEELFSNWGRPLYEPWQNKDLSLPSFQENIHPTFNYKEAALAAELSKESNGANKEESASVVASLDQQLLPSLEAAIRPRKLRSADGSSLSQRGEYDFLQTLYRLSLNDRYNDFASLLRNPSFWNSFSPEPEKTEKVETSTFDSLPSELPLLLQLEGELRSAHLPRHYSHSKNLQPFTQGISEKIDRSKGSGIAQLFTDAIEHCQHLLDELKSEKLSSSIESLLPLPIDDQSDASSNKATSGEIFREKALHWAEIIDATPGKNLSRWQALLDCLSAEQLPPEAERPGELPACGWLELPWKLEPHLLLLPFQEGCIPAKIENGSFLNDTLREQLGLSHDKQRYARDAYLLRSVCSWRSNDQHRVDILTAKSNSSGDPLLPSRLLFSCSPQQEAELPARALKLFAELSEQQQKTPASSIGFQLTLPKAANIPQQISITAFADYLKCPFRFYLSRILHLCEIDPHKMELDALDFGNLLHYALEKLGDNEELRASDQPEKIAAFLQKTVEDRMSFFYGNDLSAPLLLQQSSAIHRLSDAAEYIAQWRSEGWEFAHSELLIHKEKACADWKFGESNASKGLALRGKIDWIEYHPEQKIYRVIDFKSSKAKAAHCDGYHWKQLKSNSPEQEEDLPDYYFFSAPNDKGEEKDYLWLNLQLPLYVTAIAKIKKVDITAIEAAHFYLPAEDSPNHYCPLRFNSEHISAALSCADTIASNIAQGEFWEPREKVSYESFPKLHLGQPAKTIASDFLSPSS